MIAEKQSSLRKTRPLVSIVTPTLRRPEDVRGLLENLAGQTLLPAEIVPMPELPLLVSLIGGGLCATAVGLVFGLPGYPVSSLVSFEVFVRPALRALQAVGFQITSIRDVTPIPHNGCRPPKRRRV